MKNLPAPNQPTVINGVEFTGHALDQMQARGITSPSLVIDVVNNGVTTTGNTVNELVHTSVSGDLRVITNSSNTKIITVMPKSN